MKFSFSKKKKYNEILISFSKIYMRNNSFFNFLCEKQYIWNMVFLLKFICFYNNWYNVQQEGKVKINLVTHNQECK